MNASEETSVKDPTPRKVWVAKLFSNLAPGLGHLYCGNVPVGLTILFANACLLPLGFTVLLYSSVQSAFWVFMGLLFVGVVSMIFTTRHAKAMAAAAESYEPQPVNRWWIYALVILQPIAYIFPVTILVKQQLLEAFFIAGDSMAPALRRGDRLVVDKRKSAVATRLTGATPDWKRGDVVVFRCPGERNKIFVKRIVGVAGDTVEVDAQGVVTLNGQKIGLKELDPDEIPPDSEDLAQIGKLMLHDGDDASYPVFIRSPDEGNKQAPANVELGVDQVFVMGDNRILSRDSRHFGPVPVGDILGPASFIFFPAKSWQRFGSFSSK